MKNFKSLTLGYGIIAALALGLSGCYMDGQSAQQIDNSPQSTLSTHTPSNNTPVATKSVQKSYASKDPVQKSTPGPKHAAAPQLPVIH